MAVCTVECLECFFSSGLFLATGWVKYSPSGTLRGGMDPLNINVCCSAAPQAIVRFITERTRLSAFEVCFSWKLKPVIIWGSCLLCNQWTRVLNERIWVWETTSSNKILNIASCFSACLDNSLSLSLLRVLLFLKCPVLPLSHQKVKIMLVLWPAPLLHHFPVKFHLCSTLPLHVLLTIARYTLPASRLIDDSECERNVTHTHTLRKHRFMEVSNDTKCSREVTRTVCFLFQCRVDLYFNRNFLWTIWRKYHNANTKKQYCWYFATLSKRVTLFHAKIFCKLKKKSWKVKKDISVTFFLWERNQLQSYVTVTYYDNCNISRISRPRYSFICICPVEK